MTEELPTANEDGEVIDPQPTNVETSPFEIPRVIIEHSAETGLLFAALGKAQSAITQPKPNQEKEVSYKNKRTGNYDTKLFHYADMAQCLKAVLPHLGPNGLGMTQVPVMLTDGKWVMVTMVGHESGQWIKASYPLLKEGTSQELGGDQTYARRYSLGAVFGIATDDDDDGDGAADRTKTQDGGKAKDKTKAKATASKAAPKSQSGDSHQYGDKDAIAAGDHFEIELHPKDETMRAWVKELPLRKWNASTKKWEVPFSEEVLNVLDKAMADQRRGFSYQRIDPSMAGDAPSEPDDFAPDGVPDPTEDDMPV